MLKERESKVNVAPSSDEGHFVKGASRVVNMDDVTEAFFIEGKSQLVTKNHTSLKQTEDCLINCQVVYDPFAKMHHLARD